MLLLRALPQQELQAVGLPPRRRRLGGYSSTRWKLRATPISEMSRRCYYNGRRPRVGAAGHEHGPAAVSVHPAYRERGCSNTCKEIGKEWGIHPSSERHAAACCAS